MDANILLAIIVVLVTINAIALLIRFSAREKSEKTPPEVPPKTNVLLTGMSRTPGKHPKIEIPE